MREKLISVIIPTYNRVNYLRISVNSVIQQTYKNIEIIIVDDCSTDNTENIINRVQDKRIRYLRNKENIGAGASRNRGIKEAKGEFIAFLDDDDEWLPKKLEKQMLLFNLLPDDYGLVYCGHIIYDMNGDLIGRKKSQYRGNVLREILNGCILGGSTPLIRKTVFSKVGYNNSNLKSSIDWEMWIRIAENYKFDFVDEYLVKYIIHEDQISTKRKNRIEDLELIYKSHKKLLKLYSAELNFIKKIIRLYIIENKYDYAYRYLRRSHKINTKDINTLVKIALIILMPDILKYIIYKYSYQHLNKTIIY